MREWKNSLTRQKVNNFSRISRFLRFLRAQINPVGLSMNEVEMLGGIFVYTSFYKKLRTLCK